MRNRVAWSSLLCAAVAASVLAPIRVTTPNFELYTTESETVAREALLHFELVRAFFEHHGKALRPPPGPIRIVGFRSVDEYRPYSPVGFATAHYQAAPERESIVISSLASASYPAAVHEFVHLLVRHAGWNPPLWLGEGLAELYSTLEPLPRETIRMGDPPPGHLRVLRERPWLDLEALLAADRTSPYYSDPRLAPLFYAQSWALTHMLAFSDSYRRDFPSLVSRLAGGAGVVFHRPLAEVRKDLESYVAKNQLPSEILGLNRELPALRPVVRPVEDLEWGLVLAEQLAGLGSGLEAGKRAYEDLGRRYPARSEPSVALGYLALGRGNLEEARRQFAQAVELRSTDVKLYLDYADLASGNPDSVDRAAILRRALDLRPGDQEIQRRLALAFYDALEFEAARAWMLKTRQVSDESAPEFYRVLAYINDRLGFEAEARSAARRAVETARTAEESDAARRLLDFISRPPPQVPQVVVEAPPVPAPPEIPQLSRPAAPPAKPAVPLYAVQGDLVQFDCLGSAARIVLRTRSEKLAFRVEYPKGLVIRRGGVPVLRFITCGAQKAERVTVRYEMRRESYLGTLGVVRVLEYR